MTTQEKIKAIRKEVIKANPSILDLVFGCEVILLNEEYSKQPRVLKVLDKREIKGRDTIVEIYERSHNGIGLVFYEDKGNLKIIGRPIRLADVLLALQKNKSYNLIAVDEYGTFYSDEKDVGFDIVQVDGQNIEWNLEQDDLSKQSEETIDFIFNLICHD